MVIFSTQYNSQIILKRAQIYNVNDQTIDKALPKASLRPKSKLRTIKELIANFQFVLGLKMSLSELKLQFAGTKI